MIKLKIHSLLMICLLSATIYSCTPSSEQIVEEESVAALDLSLIDSASVPGENFYRYTNGKWLDDTEIPADRAGWGSFHELFEYNEKVLTFVLEESSKGEIYDENSNEVKAVNFFVSGMDTVKIETLKDQPLRPLLDELEAINDKGAIQYTLAKMHVIGAMAFFNEFVGIDDKQTDRYIMNLTQSGLGLPDRDYYFRTDVAGVDIINSYKQYLAKLLVLVGSDSTIAAGKADQIFALEMKLAEASMTRLERRDPETNYNKLALADVQQLSNWMDWTKFYTDINASGVIEVNVNQLEFFKQLGTTIEESELATLKDYMKTHLISSNRNYLSDDFVIVGFEFYGKKLSGQQEMRPRAKRMLNSSHKCNLFG